MKDRLKEFILITGIWFPILNFVTLIVATTVREGEWRGLDRQTFISSMLVSFLVMFFTTFGNLFRKYLYGSKKTNLLSFIEGLVLYRIYDRNDVKHIFPPINNKIKANKQKGNIIFGKWHGNITAKPLDQQSGHVNVVANTGGGKTTKCIIPSILDILSKNQEGDTSSFMAVDIKGELESITGRVCKNKGIECQYKVFNPEKENSFGFNPYFLLEGVEDKDEQVEILEEIANILIPINSGERGNAYWLEGAKAYLTGALWFYYKYKNMGFVESIKKILKVNPFDFVKQVEMWNDEYIDVYYSDIYGFAKKGEKTLNYFFSELKESVELFGVNSSIGRVLSMPDEQCIRPDDLLNGINIFLQFSEKKMTIYNKACALVINMFVRYFIGLNESEMIIPNTAWLLDEFAQLPYMPSMDRCISTIRSKGVTLVFCLQEPENQLIGKYGKESAKVFMQNCTYNIIYNIAGESAEYFSKEVGEYDKKVSSYSKSGGMRGSVTYTTRKERIITPQQIRMLKENEKAVLISPYGYAYIDVLPWYKDKKWIEE